MIIHSHHLTNASFADKIGVQRSSVSHILKGRNKPSLDFIQRVITNFPRVDAHWLITGQMKEANNEPQILDEPEPVSFQQSTLIEKEQEVKRVILFYANGKIEEIKSS
ncbi:MAG: helix-turn-helix domain-containing protein [Crocinitomicaceae bacterium]|nr:helix-turn-helix domain-containing protein [Crocinitomicaceae bacterium]